MVGKTGTKRKVGRPATARNHMMRNDSESNNNLIKEYEVFLETLENQIKRLKDMMAEELRLLDAQEEEFFQRTCNLYTAEQLAMPAIEFAKMIEEEEEHQAKQTKDVPVGGNGILQDISNSNTADEPAIVRIPIKPHPKKKRRSSVIQPYNSITATPVWRAGRIKMPNFVSKGTGIKNAKPRPARLGEIAFSDNGSPIVVMPSTKLKIPISKGGKMALADDV